MPYTQIDDILWHDPAKRDAFARRVATDADPSVTAQIIAIGADLAALTDVLRDDEHQLHELTCLMFNLSDDEKRLVERGRA